MGSCQNKINLYECDCFKGYSGLNCEKEINLCDKKPCKNMAECVHFPGSYNCICEQDSGWTGQNCDEDIDECEGFNGNLNPWCLNDSTCVNMAGSFQCECPPGFTGKYCQDEINECLNVQNNEKICQNGGTCMDNTNGFICECASGWTGELCLERGDRPCEELLVLVSGSYDENGQWDVAKVESITRTWDITFCDAKGTKNCENLDSSGESEWNTGFKCVCVDGMVGTYCSVEVNECDSSPCENGGTCIDKIGEFVCECFPKFKGEKCESEHDFCDDEAELRCANYDSSMYTDFDYNTLHADLFEGNSDKKSWCPPKLIGKEHTFSHQAEHGRCIDGVTGFQCICNLGWTGEHCNILTKHCESNPCKNGATCVEHQPVIVTEENSNGKDPMLFYYENPEATTPGINIGMRILNELHCVCSTGWTGTFCQVDENGCETITPNGNLTKNYCINGVCADAAPGKEKSFSCLCDHGYTGDYCNLEINECEEYTPCPKGSTCYDKVGGYTCICPPELPASGKQEDFEVCYSNNNICLEENPCVAPYASCINDVDGYQCICPPGYKGLNCELDVDECDSNPCVFGDCKNYVTYFVCLCWRGYSGERCSVENNECASQPCDNGGTCIEGFDFYECECPVGIVGTHCETDKNECQSNPCINGVCNDLADQFMCDCDSGFTGIECEININECASSPCTSGLCSDYIDRYVCDCSKNGFEGPDCDVDINECEFESTCRFGKCKNSPGSFVCNCDRGFTGSRCEINIDECVYHQCNERQGSCVDGDGEYNLQMRHRLHRPILPARLRRMQLGTMQKRRHLPK